MRKIVAKSLYGRAKMGGLGHFDNTYLEGELHQLYHFFNKLDLQQHLIIALRYAWESQQLFSEDKELKKIVRDLALDLTKYYPTFSEFKVAIPGQNKTEVVEEQPQDSTKELSKYDKIKQKTNQLPTDTVANDQFWRLAFVDVLENPNLKTVFDKAIEDRKEAEKDEAYYKSSEWLSFRKKIRKKGHFFGIDSIVLVNPIYTKISNDIWASKTETMHLDSEKQHSDFIKILKNDIKLVKLHAPILDMASLKAEDTEVFNDIVTMNEWFSQHLEDVSSMAGTDQENVDKIAQKYGTRYFAWAGLLAQRYARLGVSNRVWYFFILFDVKTGAYETIKYQYLKGKGLGAAVNSHTYDGLFQVKRYNKKMQAPEQKEVGKK